MNILIPTADYPPIEGGIGTVSLQLSRELAALGHTVTVVAPHFPGMETFDAAEPARIVRYRGYRLGWFRFFPMLFKSVRFLPSTDLVLGINIAYGGVIGRLGRAFFGKPYVAFAYAYEFLKFRWNPPARWLLRHVYRRARRVVAISAFTRDRLIEFGVEAAAIDVIPPGAPEPAPVDDTALQALKERYVLNGHRIVLGVGRFIPRKGHATLVEALPKILERHPDTVLVLVGRGPSLARTTQVAGKLGIRDRIRLPGRIDDSELAALYTLCDCFALPTGADERGQVEGFGLVFSEAHAYGKPVVAGRSGGVVDAVLDGETGILVAPDDPDALAEAILSLLDDPDRARAMGEAGRKRVEEELNWTRFTQRMLEAVEADS